MKKHPILSQKTLNHNENYWSFQQLCYPIKSLLLLLTIIIINPFGPGILLKIALWS